MVSFNRLECLKVAGDAFENGPTSDICLLHSWIKLGGEYIIFKIAMIEA